MNDFDVSLLIRKNKMMAPNADFESEYTFFYDETNNIKKFCIKDNHFNNNFTANFILGGVAFLNDAQDVTPLFESFKLQNNVKEVKFDHIAKGSFLDCLNSRKLLLFSEFIFESDFYIHYSRFNLLFWSIVDIVDSALMSSDSNQQFITYNQQLKNTLYKLIKLEINSVVPIFNKYKYPNIDSKSVIPFINDLCLLFNGYLKDDEYKYGLKLLYDLLAEAKNNNELPFLSEEEDYILVKDFAHLYLRPIYIFKNSKHIFDNEDSIKDIMNTIRIIDNGNEIKNYTFKDSKSEKLIQLSDIFVGIMGKLTSYLNIKSSEEIKLDLKNLNTIQKNNIELLIKLIDKSQEKNIGLIFNVDSEEELSKLKLIKV